MSTRSGANVPDELYVDQQTLKPDDEATFCLINISGRSTCSSVHCRWQSTSWFELILVLEKQSIRFQVQISVNVYFQFQLCPMKISLRWNQQPSATCSRQLLVLGELAMLSIAGRWRPTCALLSNSSTCIALCVVVFYRPYCYLSVGPSVCLCWINLLRVWSDIKVRRPPTRSGVRLRYDLKSSWFSDRRE